MCHSSVNFLYVKVIPQAFYTPVRNSKHKTNGAKIVNGNIQVDSEAQAAGWRLRFYIERDLGGIDTSRAVTLWRRAVLVCVPQNTSSTQSSKTLSWPENSPVL